jgi:hypothetical protein
MAPIMASHCGHSRFCTFSLNLFSCVFMLILVPRVPPCTNAENLKQMQGCPRALNCQPSAASQPASGSQPASQPASQSASQQVSQPANQLPASQSASQPASQPASQSASSMGAIGRLNWEQFIMILLTKDVALEETLDNPTIG